MLHHQLAKQHQIKLTPCAVDRSLKSWCASLGDECELLSLSIALLLARRLARLDEVSPRLQRLAASLDHLAVPIRQLSLIADTVRQAELEHFAAEIVLLVVSAPISEARAAAMHGGFDGSSLDGPNK